MTTVFTLDNIITVLRQTSILFLLSQGLTVVILTGNIDFSVGPLAALCGCICAQMIVHGFPAGLGIVSALMTGAAFGLTNGLLVGKLKLPSFVATYGMSMVASGLATIVMNGGVIYGLPADLTALGAGTVGILPVPVIVTGITFAFLYAVLKKTSFGRCVYLTGLNQSAARYSGINSLMTILAAYLLSGLFGAAGGVVMTARLNAADAGMTEAYGLKIIAAVVVGGSSLLGGEGGVERTFLGALVLTVISNIMNIAGIASEWQNLVFGVIILLIGGLDYSRHHRS